MIDQLRAGHTLALLHKSIAGQEGKKVLTGEVQVALIPDEQFDPICEEISNIMGLLKRVQRERHLLLSEGAIQGAAAECSACDLCLVCAGKHYTYSRNFDACWPPGQEKCFAFMIKSGAPLRDAACALCSKHDLDLRTARADRRRSLSKESELRSQLQKVHARRQALFDEFNVAVHVFSE